jgi:flagellar M-ring protein FliF
MPRRQLIIFSAVFVSLVALLTAAYFLSLRADYVPLFEDLRESDASAIVTELDKQGIGYKLANNGRDVLVSEQDVGTARVGLAGSDVTLGGIVGFELFNESDMGLTEFAQKINYQRALQGELARTIMSMDDIAFSRVHLALPEKSIFRSAQVQPTAAVTLQTKNGKELSPARVAGIQQLVAAAVSDLPPGNVSVLDEGGRLLSEVVSASPEVSAPLDERSALESYFKARALQVASRVVPGLRAEVRVFAKELKGAAADTAAGDAENTQTPALRNFTLRVFLRTAASLNSEDTELLRSALSEALQLNADAGDMLEFEVGPLGTSPPTQTAPAFDAYSDMSAPMEAAPASPATPLAWFDTIFNRWFFGFVFLFSVVAWLLWRRRRQLSDEDRIAFAELLQNGLTAQQAKADAA